MRRYAFRVTCAWILLGAATLWCPEVRTQEVAPSIETPTAQVDALYTRLITEPDANVRVQITHELSALGAPAAAHAAKALRNTNDPVMPYAHNILKDIGAPAAPALSQTIISTTDYHRLYGLLEEVSWLGPTFKDVAPALQSTLKVQYPEVRKEALRALAAMGEGAVPALPDVVPLMRGEESSIASCAIRVVGNCGAAAEPQIPTLIALVYIDPATHVPVNPLEGWSTRQVAAIDALGCLGPRAHSAMPCIQACLSEQDRDLFTAALKALPKIGPPDPESLDPVLQAITKFFRSDDFEFCRALARFLTDATAPQNPGASVSAARIAKALEGPDTRLRDVVLDVLILGDAKVPGVEQTLIGMLKDPNEAVRLRSASALERTSNAKPLIDALETAESQNDTQLRDLLFTLLANSAPLPPEVLSSFDRSLRRAMAEGVERVGDAARALRKSGPEGNRLLVNLYIEGERKGTPEWQGWTIDIEHALKRTEAAPFLLQAIKDEIATPTSINSGYPGLAIKLTRMLPVSALGEVLDSPDKGVRKEAIRALHDAGEKAKPFFPQLFAALGDSDYAVRVAAIRALGSAGVSAQEAVPAFTTALRDPHPAVRGEAAFALAQTGGCAPETIAGLEALLDDTLKVIPWIIGGEHDTVKEAFVNFWPDEYKKPWMAAALALGRLAPEHPEAVEALVRALQHEQPTVRRAAANALLEAKAAVDKALPVALEVLHSEDWQERTSAFQALSKAGVAAASAAPALREAAGKLKEENEAAAYIELARKLDFAGFHSEVVRTETTSDRADYRHYDIALRLEDTCAVPLGKLYDQIPPEGEDAKSESLNHLGVDESTLELKWLEKDRLLWAYWETFQQGRGINTMASNLILLKTGPAWREIYRDSKANAYHESVLEGYSLNFSFAYNPTTKELSTLVTEDQHWVSETKVPLAKPGGRSDKDFSCGRNTRTESRYRVEEDALTYIDGKEFLLLGEQTVDIREVAEALEADANGVEARITALRKLNPSLRENNSCTGDVLIAAGLPEPTLSKEQRYSASDEN